MTSVLLELAWIWSATDKNCREQRSCNCMNNRLLNAVGVT